MSIAPSVLRARIENAAEYVGPLWPLQTFNAANPLSGFEDLSFDRAVQQARHLFGGRGYPSASTFRQAWENGEIRPAVLTDRLDAHGITEPPEALLDRMEADENGRTTRAAEADSNALDRVLTKWLAAFLDQGQAAWPMPGREEGFYAAWRALAPYDDAVADVRRPSDLPSTRLAAFEEVLASYPEDRWEPIFVHHFSALPGWVGFIRWRAQADEHPWQDAYPISLADYLAVRLVLAKRMGATIAPDRTEDLPDVSGEEGTSLAAIWLEAWEESYRERLLADVDRATTDRATGRTNTSADAGEGRPDAQWVFCIDVRSEIIRRHLENAGNHETHGYAGFFGIPMQHERYGDGTRVKSCPPILDPRHRIADRPAPEQEGEAERYDAWSDLTGAFRKLLKTLKDNVAAAFGFVEGSGGFFGAAMAARTLLPSALFRAGQRLEDRVPGPEAFCRPTVDRPESADEDAGGLPLGLSREAKIVYAEAAFRLMGWTEAFAPVVVFTGHGSQTPNNPYKSSLDCGACAANPGGPNARVLAAICNEDAVREALRERGIDIPDDTVFLAGEHNTTTDAIRLFVDDTDPPIAPETLAALRADLEEAQQNATAERVKTMNAGRPSVSVQEVQRRAGDWAETRPEWGLAGNAGFIVGPRSLTQSLDLNGRCFLHSYDWQVDDDGTALENIMTGPLVVGEWINTQYYFSTVDNAAYGSGSKVTHNVVGNLGVVQGNGGDLMSGLPLQSLQSDDRRVYHRPLRLMALIQAPLGRVEEILRRQNTVRQLFDHRWVALTVMDPERSNAFLRYRPGGEWDLQPPTPAAAGDAVDTVADLDESLQPSSL
jgi:uncharacterized protein YbcC (UPF0753/DUF2309 family)